MAEEHNQSDTQTKKTKDFILRRTVISHWQPNKPKEKPRLKQKNPKRQIDQTLKEVWEETNLKQNNFQRFFAESFKPLKDMDLKLLE